MATAGAVTEYSSGISPNSDPFEITLGPDGNLRFTEYNRQRIAKITPSGVVSEYPLPSCGSFNCLPTDITDGPDGNLWFTEQSGNTIGRITTSGVITEYSNGISSGAGTASITAGPDGNLWFTEVLASNIGKITTSGVVTEYSTGITSGRGHITTGPDGTCGSPSGSATSSQESRPLVW